MSRAPDERAPARNREVARKAVSGTALIFLGVLGFIVSPILGFVGAFANPIIGILLWVGGSSLSGWLISRGKRYRARSANSVLARDPRAPILYLRSFGADSKAAQKVGRALSIKGIDLTTPSTEEEQIASVVQRVGPLVAIGRPDENVPLLGAARMYVADDEWQDKVLDMMRRSCIVVMRAGKTEGYWWEVETAVRLVPPERLLWLVPFSGENYQAFAARANTLLPKPLPPDSGKFSSAIGSFKAWIWFSPDWTPHLERPRASDPQSTGYPVAMWMQRVLKLYFLRMGETKAALYCSGLRRFAAAAIDCAILGGLIVLAFNIGFSGDGSGSVTALGVLLFCLAVAYVVLLDLPKLGGTPGKRAMHLKTVGEDGAPLSNGRALVRGIFKLPMLILLPLTFLYGLVAMHWTLRRRLPHDLLARTYVIDPAW